MLLLKYDSKRTGTCFVVPLKTPVRNGWWKQIAVSDEYASAGSVSSSKWPHEGLQFNGRVAGDICALLPCAEQSLQECIEVYSEVRLWRRTMKSVRVNIRRWECSAG